MRSRFFFIMGKVSITWTTQDLIVVKWAVLRDVLVLLAMRLFFFSGE